MATFTLYNPTTHTLPQLAAALLDADSRISIVADSIVLRYGTGTVLSGTSSTTTTSISLYDGTITELNMARGLFLSSGDGAPPATNTEGAYSTELVPSHADSDLTAAVLAGFDYAGDVQDVTSLQFQFTVTDPGLSGVQFDLVFASDEYPEFSDTSFVDIAGIFINGTNFGLFNGRVDQPLSIIERNLAAGGFRNNEQSAIPIEYDGVSVKLTIVAPVQPGVNTIKIAIGDTGDSIYDSGLFVSNLRAVPYTFSGLGTLVQGGVTSDVFMGMDFNEVFDLGDGNDTVTGSGGDDLLVGGAGIDVALYRGSRGSYVITRTPDGGYTVADGDPSRDGTDTLNSLERLHFSDNRIALDLGSGQSAGNTVRIIGAAFGAPNIQLHPDWVGIGLNLFDSGTSMLGVCELVVPILGLNNTGFVNAVFQNVVGRPASAAERDLYVGLLQGSGGSMTQAALLVLAADADVNAVSINLVGLQQGGVGFVA